MGVKVSLQTPSVYRALRAHAWIQEMIHAYESPIPSVCESEGHVWSSWMTLVPSEVDRGSFSEVKGGCFMTPEGFPTHEARARWSLAGYHIMVMPASQVRSSFFQTHTHAEKTSSFWKVMGEHLQNLTPGSLFWFWQPKTGSIQGPAPDEVVTWLTSVPSLSSRKGYIQGEGVWSWSSPWLTSGVSVMTMVDTCVQPSVLLVNALEMQSQPSHSNEGKDHSNEGKEV